MPVARRFLAFSFLASFVLGACGSSVETEPDTLAFAASAASTELVLLDSARITSRPGEPSFQHARGVAVLPDRRFARVVLVVDLGTTCFPFSAWASDPPPPGHRWPASCDAFDRSFEITLADPAAPGTPAIELLRAATPFGGPLHVETDVTDTIHALAGTTRTLDAYISTSYDANGQVSGADGGWNVSARLRFVEGPPPRDVLAVIPLQHGPLGAADARRAFDFVLPPGTTSARIAYTETGHGLGASPGCAGPAEEFCHRTHALAIDGAPLATTDPWRSDCHTLCTMVGGGPGGREYCKENPCGLPSSVRAPRSNWCPGSVTPALSFEPEALQRPGPHTLGLELGPVGERGSWRISAHVLAYGGRER